MAVAARTESETVRREQILASARKVFREKGYDNTTVSDIVKDAGIAQGTFYLYFPSKKDVVMALGQQLLDEMAVKLAAAYNPAHTFEEKLRRMVRTSFEVGGEYPDLCRLLHFGAESLGEELHQSIGEHQVLKGMIMMLQEAIGSGEMEPMDPEIVARLLSRIMPSALQEAYVFGDGSDADRVEATMEAIVVNALTKKR